MVPMITYMYYPTSRKARQNDEQPFCIFTLFGLLKTRAKTESMCKTLNLFTVQQMRISMERFSGEGSNLSIKYSFHYTWSHTKYLNRHHLQNNNDDNNNNNNNNSNNNKNQANHSSLYLDYIHEGKPFCIFTVISLEKSG